MTMSNSLNFEVMHPLKGYVPVTYSTRLTLTHTKAALATILKPKKQFSELQSVSPNPRSRCRRTEPPPSPPSLGTEPSHGSHQAVVSHYWVC